MNRRKDTLGHEILQVADYERALSINGYYAQLTVNVADVPFWMSDGEAFAFCRTVRGRRQFILVNVVKGAKQLAFDHDKLAAALTRANPEALRR